MTTSKKTSSRRAPSAPVATAAASNAGARQRLQTESSAPASFLREVDEAIQQEKILNFWRRWRWWGAGALAASLVLMVGWQGWQAWQQHQLRTFAANYAALPNDASPQQLAELQADAPTGYAALIAFRLAQMAETPAAKAQAYLAIATRDGQPEWLQHLARFHAAMALLGTDDTAAKTQLELLAQTSNPQTISPMAPLALEQLALLSQRLNEPAPALAYTQKLLNIPNLPQTLRARAELRQGYLQQQTTPN